MTDEKTSGILKCTVSPLLSLVRSRLAVGASGWGGQSAIQRLRKRRVSIHHGTDGENFERLNAKAPLVVEDPLWQNFTFHRFGLIISAIFALIAVVMSGYLISRHCTHYLKPWEQRQ